MFSAVVGYIKHPLAQFSKSDKIFSLLYKNIVKKLSFHLFIICGEPGIGSAPTQSTPSQSVITVSKELIQSLTSASDMETTSLQTGLEVILEVILVEVKWN